MRADMFKVIVERPRVNASHAPSPKLKRISDQNIKSIGLKRHARISAAYGKGFNENLRPLVRFLRSRRGQRWDDVFSEICACLDTGSAVKMHVRQHLEDFVMTRISLGRSGEWMFEGLVIGRETIFQRQTPFFVDPEDGLLKDRSELEVRLPEVNRPKKGGAR